MWRQDKGFDEATPDQQRAARAGYYGMVTMVDEAIGQIVAALDETGLRERTAVFYTSDHGDMLGELGLWHKSTLYEGSVGVPLIASWPERFASGTTVNDPVSLIDLAPTFASLGGGPAPTPHHRTGAHSVAGGARTTGRVAAGRLRGEHARLRLPAQPDDPARPVEARALPRVCGSRAVQPGRRPARATRPGRPIPSCVAVRDELDALVRAGWSGAAVERAVARHQTDRNVLDAWAAALHPAAPDLWHAPPGSNSFPE